MDYTPLLLTFKLAFITTCILMVISLPLAYWLRYSKWRFKVVVEALVSMPLVLPPTVLGFYMLLAFSPNNAFGEWLENELGIRLLFSFPGLVLGSVIYSLPFMVQPLLSGFHALPINLKEASYSMGKSRLTTLWRVLLPNMRASVMSGIVLSFAHTIGEFGVVLMIGGNLPAKTRVASIAIYEEVEALNYATANQYALVLFGITLSLLILTFSLNRKFLKSSAL